MRRKVMRESDDIEGCSKNRWLLLFMIVARRTTPCGMCHTPYIRGVTSYLRGVTFYIRGVTSNLRGVTSYIRRVTSYLLGVASYM